MRHHQLHLLACLVGGADPHHLHLRELVQPDQPAGVPPVRAGLRTEARGVRGQCQRQLGRRHDLVRVQVGQRHLGGRDQEQVAVGDARPEQVLLELRQLPGAGHGAAVHQVRHRVLDVAVPAGVQVQQERDDRPLQRGTGAAQHAEPRTRQLGGPAEVHDPHDLAEVDVVLRGEVERPRLADPAQLGGVLVREAVRRLVRGQVRDRQQQVRQLLLDGHHFGLVLLDLLLQRAGALLQLRDVAALLGRPLHLLRDLLGAGPQLVAGLDARVAAGLQRLQCGQVEPVAATCEPSDGLVPQVDQGAGIMHRSLLLGTAR